MSFALSALISIMAQGYWTNVEVPFEADEIQVASHDTCRIVDSRGFQPEPYTRAVWTDGERFGIECEY